MRVGMHIWWRLFPGLCLLALCACAACRSPSPAAATSPNAVGRLCDLRPAIKRQWLAYREKETDAHRSLEFATLAFQIDQTCFGPSGSRTNPADRATEVEVLSFLGLPDCGVTYGTEAVYVYYYWRTDTNSRSVAIVEIKNSMLDCIGYNGATVNDFSSYDQYKRWSDVPALAR